MQQLTFLLLLALSGIVLTFCASAQTEIPLHNFAQLPDVEKVEISPSGNKLAMLKRVISKGQRLFVIEITDLQTGKKSYPVVRRKHEYDVNELIWASDELILLKIDFFKQLMLENTGRNPKITERRLMVLNLKDNTLKNILSGKNMNRFKRLGWQPQFQDLIVDMLPNEPDYILHAIDWDARQNPQLFKVNLKTLERKTVLFGKENWVKFITDQQSDIRVGIQKEIISGGLVDTRTEYQIHVKNIDTQDWEILWQFEAGSADAIWPLGFTSDPNILLVEALHNGRDAIFQVDLKEPKIKTLLHSSKTKNVGGELFYSNKHDNPVGFYTLNGINFWDQEYVNFNESLNNALANTTNHLKSFSRDENKYIVYATSDIDSGTWYLGDRAQKALNPVAFKYQGLDPAAMVANTRHIVTAQDNKKVEIFVSQPKQGDVSNNATVIYASHGRGSAAIGGFNYLVQLLVNRGYTVIQVNFRHGTGNYYNFMRGDVSEWAPNLYNDLVDAANWAVEQNYTDKQNTCLFGRRFAGYIALMAAAKYDFPFSCVATIGAMTDINNHLFNSKGFVSHEQLTAYLSDDNAIQKAFSPITYSSTFRPPVLLVHGENDGHIRANQSEDMHNALLRSNKNSQHIEVRNEDSSLSTDESRLAVFGAIEGFFNEHFKKTKSP